MSKTIIYDGDMGGDDLWALAVLLAHQDKFNLKGIASVFGNVSNLIDPTTEVQKNATRNVQNFLHWLGIDNIPVVHGTAKPYDGMSPFGDNAYGADGIGGVILAESPVSLTQVDIADWYAAQLTPETNPVTILATGPATNLAMFAEKYDHLLDKVEEVIFMGGAMNTPGKNGLPVVLENGERRIGNITAYAEFNAYQDPAALNLLLSKPNLQMTFMAADATQYMVLNPARQERIKALHHTYGAAFHRMLMAVEELDRTKFGVDGPFIHDPNVVTYLLAPNAYKKELVQGLHFVEDVPDFDKRRGQATILKGAFTRAQWVNGILDEAAVFEEIYKGLRTTIARAPENPAPLAG